MTREINAFKLGAVIRAVSRFFSRGTWVVDATTFALVIVYWSPPTERTRRHELAHVAQARRMGVISYFVTYFWQFCRYGYDNPMEREAREAEAGEE